MYTAVYLVTRGLDPGRVFGSFQQDGVPNITGGFTADGRDAAPYGAFYLRSNSVGNDGSGNGGNYGIDASRCSSVYQNISEARVKNRAYLPVIKY